MPVIACNSCASSAMKSSISLCSAFVSKNLPVYLKLLSILAGILWNWGLLLPFTKAGFVLLNSFWILMKKFDLDSFVLRYSKSEGSWLRNSWTKKAAGWMSLDWCHRVRLILWIHPLLSFVVMPSKVLNKGFLRLRKLLSWSCIDGAYWLIWVLSFGWGLRCLLR